MRRSHCKTSYRPSASPAQIATADTVDLLRSFDFVHSAPGQASCFSMLTAPACARHHHPRADGCPGEEYVCPEAASPRSAGGAGGGFEQQPLGVRSHLLIEAIDALL